jgi:hypothetical protein
MTASAKRADPSGFRCERTGPPRPGPCEGLGARPCSGCNWVPDIARIHLREELPFQRHRPIPRSRRASPDCALPGGLTTSTSTTLIRARWSRSPRNGHDEVPAFHADRWGTPRSLRLSTSLGPRMSTTRNQYEDSPATMPSTRARDRNPDRFRVSSFIDGPLECAARRALTSLRPRPPGWFESRSDCKGLRRASCDRRF